MKIETQLKKGVLLATVAGELDMHVADEFRNQLDEALSETDTNVLLLNLKDVAFIDSSGLGVIIGRYKRLNSNNGKLLISNATPQVSRILELSGLTKIIRVYDSESEAFERL